MNNVIEATILNGKFNGEDVLLPRIPMIPTDMPLEFKRTKFGKSMLLTWRTCCGLLTRWKTF
jgi:hypothetical protein